MAHHNRLETHGVCLCFAMLMFLGRDADAQTNCATQHTSSGAFICYPNPAENGADSIVPDIFHLSAQVNAPNGQAVARYTVLIDGHLVYENRLAIPIQRLSIETNLKSPFDSGSHTVQLVVDGVGSAEVKGLQVYPSKNASFCDPFSRFDTRACSIMPNMRGPLRWSLKESAPQASTPANARKRTASFDGYFPYMELYGQNLKSTEADASDAVAVDAQENLYVASHVFADMELRKYAPDGSIIYDSLIRSCGDGFLSVAGLAIDNAGRAWIAGNTNACFPTTPNAVQSHVSEAGRTRGFVMLVDTAKPSSFGPLYATYLADVANRIAAIRVDSEGNAYVTGTTASFEFPHELSLSVAEDSARSRSTRLSFVSVLNPSGSGLQWSTLLQDAHLTALVLDRAGNVYVTGSVASRRSSFESRGSVGTARPARHSCGGQGRPAKECDDVLVAELSDRGRRLSYMARFGGSGDEEGRAISTSAQGAWVLVAGNTDSRDFPTSLVTNTSHRESLQSFAVALQPCRTGVLYSRLIPEAHNRVAPGIALAPALDAFTTAFPVALTVAELAKAR